MIPFNPYPPPVALVVFFVLALVGACTVFVGLVAGLFWLVNHVRFV
jgi:hypothetical protein